MKTITAIMVVAVGAILTFAINAHPGFISPQIVGLVLMLTGITGLCLNQRGTGLLDRQLVMLRHLLGQDASAISGRRFRWTNCSTMSSPATSSPATIGANPSAPLRGRRSHRTIRRPVKSPLTHPDVT